MEVDPEFVVSTLRHGLDVDEGGLNVEDVLTYLKKREFIKGFQELSVGLFIEGVGHEILEQTVLRSIRISPDPILMAIKVYEQDGSRNTDKDRTDGIWGEYKKPTDKIKGGHLVIACGVLGEDIICQDPNYQDLVKLPYDQIKKRIMGIYRIQIKSQDEVNYDEHLLTIKIKSTIIKLHYESILKNTNPKQQGRNCCLLRKA